MDVRVLGPLEIVSDGVRLDMTSPTQRRILGVLVSRRGEAVIPEQLAETVGVSLRALRTAISRLRTLAGDGVVVTRPEGYTLGEVGVDADLFEDLLGAARDVEPHAAVAALDAALEVWRGDPYGEFADTEWAQPVVSRLVELRASAIEDRGEALLALGRSSDAVAAMTAHASEHPLRDRPVELLMRGLASQGRQAEALRCFRAYRRHLVDEAGLEPGSRLIDVDARIAAGWNDAPLHGSESSLEHGDRPVGNVRSPVTSFVGRDRAVDQVNDAIGRHRLVTLIGVGGVGKTRLAVECALRSRDWPDGAWMVELGSIQREDDVAETVARALSIRLGSGLSGIESVVRWCQQRTLLLVLDNCEHVLRSTARLVDALATATDGVTVLATSREPLSVSGEHVVSVPPLALVDDGSGGGGAVELFIERARSESAAFDPDLHGDAIVRVCRRLDGLPLALELAAARVRGLSVDEIASRLDARFGLLTVGRRTAIARHATLRATVDWSYDLLLDGERRIFDALSVFAGPFTLEDAVAMVVDDGDERTAIDALSHLVDCSLILRSDTSPEYRLLETLREYGRERLDSAGRARQTRDQHVALMVRKAAQARVDAAGPDEDRIVRVLRAQIADYAAAVDWAASEGSPDVAARIAEDFFIPVSLWGHNSEPGLWMRDLLAADFKSPAAMAANRWIASHWFMFFGNDLDRSVALAGEAVELDPDSGWARVMATFGAVLSGRSDDAREIAVDARLCARDPGEQAGSFIAMGTTLLRTGDVSGATQTADDFVAWAKERRFPSATAMALFVRGQALAEQQPAEALRTFERALEHIRAEIPNCWNVETLIRRDMIPLVHRSTPGEAPALALVALRACVRHNETGNIAELFAHVATVLADAGHSEAAARAVGAAGGALRAPTIAATVENTKDTLRAALGDRYEILVTQGSESSAMGTARSIIDLLEAPT